ncbi:hypothetical protein LTS18_004362, partial [Coniosporium uncinatum]
MAHLPSLPIRPTLTSDRSDALLIVTLRRTTDDTKALLEAAINNAIEANGTSTSPTIYYASCKDNAAQANVEWQGLDGCVADLHKIMRRAKAAQWSHVLVVDDLTIRVLRGKAWPADERDAEGDLDEDEEPLQQGFYHASQLEDLDMPPKGKPKTPSAVLIQAEIKQTTAGGVLARRMKLCDAVRAACQKSHPNLASPKAAKENGLFSTAGLAL